METNPVELVYEEMGAGFPLILVHGFPLNRSIWTPVAKKLEAHARVILLDLRGHGESPVTDGAYSMRLLAADIIELMDRLQIERAVVAGHSMGGYVALAFALAHPQRLAGLGMVASQAAADTLEKRQARLNQAEEVLKKGVKAIAASMPAKLTADPALQKKLSSMIAKTARLGVAGALQGIAERVDSIPRLPEITVPAVVISGLKDAIIPREQGQLLAQLLGHAMLVELPEAGHMAMLEAPDETANALLQLVQMAQSA